MPLLSHPNPNELALSIRASALVFEDPQSRELLARIDLVAPTDMTVLVIGETGTGKELVARHIHELSVRKHRPFFAVNCGALSENLIESELFGHEKGAFTGASSTKQGWFEAASGGTLFLDEIGDLSMPMQVKLLRVLQQKEVVRVGSHRPIPIDVRLIAATNVKLEEAILAGRFREDLYYRLNVAPLRLLPLRQRPGDILPLAEHFLAFYSKRLGNPETRISPAAAEALLRHSWPGNIRELENVIHHALLVARNQTIAPSDLNLSPLPTPGAASRGDDFEALTEILERLLESNLPDIHARIEAAVVKAAHRLAGGNQLQTARLLGLSRHVIRAKLIRYGVLKSAAKTPENWTDASGVRAFEGIPLPGFPHGMPARPDARQCGLGDASEEWWGY
ncbi:MULTISPECIES: sigma-54 interaction domain-containing protein [Methylococcus]|jgi:sigma-54-specific transcriptional regulator|uniref:Sigma54-dependent transcriptional regulator SfnR n=1 Tax=Methylococcus capsulatus TaxID=414 RepID=A0AA35V553_METCP|nr:sigma 54-interacting transcriptional regulator [Methylococcus capsulatus]CAI8839440.1 Sigma54-dependent transcriptional regulator SfnR [Methylococcus capsulatus]